MSEFLLRSRRLRIKTSQNGSSSNGRQPGIVGQNKINFGLSPLQLKKDYDWIKTNLNITLKKHGLMQLSQIIEKYGQYLLKLPYSVPKTGKFASYEQSPNIIFKLPPMSKLFEKDREIIRKLLGFNTDDLNGRAIHIAYHNDGGSPNTGSGSDQGATAYLGLFLINESESAGLRRIGWTLIDMKTPRGFLASGTPHNKDSLYETAVAPYRGISSIDFEVRVSKSKQITIDLIAQVGIDSARWGKFIQDFVHKHISNSPLFPWPEDVIKFYAQGGAVLQVTPKWMEGQAEFLGIQYNGKLVFSGKFETGTHDTELSAGVSYQIQSAKYNLLGYTVRLEASMGVEGRAFIRKNHGIENDSKGVELNVSKKIMVRMGKIGIGLGGNILFSQDPSFQTDNKSGTHPLINPMPQVIGGEPTGGSLGHHGEGHILLEYRF